MLLLIGQNFYDNLLNYICLFLNYIDQQAFRKELNSVCNITPKSRIQLAITI